MNDNGKTVIASWAERALGSTLEDWKILGPELKKIRKEIDWTADKVASACAVCVPTVYSWESGRRSIPPRKIRRIVLLFEEVLYNEAKRQDRERGINMNLALLLSSRLSYLGLSQITLSRITTIDKGAINRMCLVGQCSVGNVKKVAEGLCLSPRHLASLVCDVDSVDPQKDISTLLQSLRGLNGITFEELEELLLNPSENPTDQLRVIRQQKEERLFQIALFKLTDEQKDLVLEKMKS